MTNPASEKEPSVEGLMELAEDYAHCYAFVGAITVPLKEAALRTYAERLAAPKLNSSQQEAPQRYNPPSESVLRSVVRRCESGAAWDATAASLILRAANELSELRAFIERPSPVQPLTEAQIDAAFEAHMEGGEVNYNTSFHDIWFSAVKWVVEAAHSIGAAAAPVADCPHAFPHRYCDGCKVSPCPVGLGERK